MTLIAIVNHSGFGHTRRQAEFVHAGACQTDADVRLLPINDEGDIDAHAWDALLAADGVMFSSPTYMGGPSWQFKKFAEASAKPSYYRFRQLISYRTGFYLSPAATSVGSQPSCP